MKNEAVNTQGQSQRLVALDGIRGIAIFFVILNHIPLGILYPKLPEFFHPLITILLSNGKTGVSLLFLLSGFLMMWLYPQPASTFGFWSKRYARVFPPFLVMVFALAFIRSFKFLLPEESLIQMSVDPWMYGRLALPIVLGVAVLGRLLWEVGVFIQRKFPIGKVLFAGFLLAQVAVAAWYVFVLLRVPPAEFYMTWSPQAQMISTAVVNGTLTLPFGQYIAQLDGVYWSLITEIFFYLLYPVLLVPIVGAVLQKKSRTLNILLLITVMPFLFGMKLISERVLGFSIMQIHLFMYFVIGMTLALVLRTKEEWKGQLLKAVPIIKHPISILFCLVALFSSVMLYGSLQNFYHPWVQLLWSFLIGAVLFITLIPESSFGKWLEHPVLVALGKYSFSLYLIHSLVVEVFTHGRPEPTTLTEAAVLTAVTFIVSVILAKVLFFIIEAPYFNIRKVTTKPLEATAKIKPKTDKPRFPTYSPRTARVAVVGLTVMTFFLIYTGYKSLASFFTLSVPHTNLPLRLNASPRTIPLTTETLRYEFVGDADNLGMITTSLKAGEVKNDGVIQASDIPGVLQIRLLDENNALLAQTEYKVHEIGESRYHPFGFPVIADAKGKKFFVEYQITQDDPARALVIEASDAQFRTLYLTNKSELLKQPMKFASFVLNKLTEPFLKSSTLYTILHVVPFLGLLFFTVFRGESREKMVK